MKSPKIVKLHFFTPRYFLYDLARILGAIPGLIILRPKFIYTSNEAKKKIKGGAIIMMNHTGYIDPILSQYAVWYRRQHFIAAKEIYHNKLLEIVFTLFRCIKIDRENFTLASFRDITTHLNLGNIVTIFPEGHINTDSKDEAIAGFKSGIVMMALRSHAPIVPIYGEKRKGFGRAVFCIGEPIYLNEKYGNMPSLGTVEEISKELRETEIKLYNKAKSEGIQK